MLPCTLSRPNIITRSLSAFVQPDFMSMRRPDLMYELCYSHPGSGKDISRKIHGIQPWVSAFIKASHILESYIVLQSKQTVTTTMGMYRNIDPDFACGVVAKRSQPAEMKNALLLQEIVFINQFSSMLKRAGYKEVPAAAIRKRLKTRHKHGKVALKVPFEKHNFLRMWVKGKKQFFEDNRGRFRGESFCDRKWNGLLHERVVVVSKSLGSNHMHIKAFKEVPLLHFEVVMPDVKLSMPWYNSGLIWFSFCTTTCVSYFTDGMDVIFDFGFDQRSIALFSIAYACYKFWNMYRSEKLEYILSRKKLLYYKNTANNSSVVGKVVNDAYERQFKETLLVYGTILKLNATESKTCEKDVISAACEFLSQFHKAKVKENHINFASAFRLLKSLGVLEKSGEDKSLFVLSPEDAAAYLNKNLLKVASKGSRKTVSSSNLWST